MGVVYRCPEASALVLPGLLVTTGEEGGPEAAAARLLSAALSSVMIMRFNTATAHAQVSSSCVSVGRGITASTPWHIARLGRASAVAILIAGPREILREVEKEPARQRASTSVADFRSRTLIRLHR